MSHRLSRRRVEKLLRLARITPSFAGHREGKVGIRLLGHREYVGGLWDEIGELQFDFLIQEGLRPDDILLDVGCGSLRGGVRFVPYLDPGHYLGIDKEAMLLKAGRDELGPDLVREKRPELIVSKNFEFERFSLRPTFALAQSLFSHLERADILFCLERLRPVMADSGRFYATFNEHEEAVEPPRSHSWAFFAYPADVLADLGLRTDWQPQYIGDIGHPRGQVVMRFDAA